MTTVEQVESMTEATEGEGVRRRDFIHIAATSWAGIGAVAVALPLVNQSAFALRRSLAKSARTCST